MLNFMQEVWMYPFTSHYNQRKCLSRFAALLGISLVLISGQAFAEAQVLTLKEAVSQTKQNPRLAASLANAAAYGFQSVQVSSLPDPVLSLNVLSLPVDSFSRSQEAMTQLQIGISQSFPFPGKLGLKESINQANTHAAASQTKTLRLSLISQCKQRWWSIFYNDRALETVAKNLELLRQLTQVAESKYKVGAGLQQDVLLAQLELSKLLDMQIQLQASRQQEVAQLNRLRNRPASQAISLPKVVNELLGDIPDEQVLTAQALQSRPELVAQTFVIDAAQSSAALADKDDYPDFTLGASYGLRASDPVTNKDRADLASITLSMTLPFFGESKHAQTQQRQAETAREDFKYQDMKNAVLSEISQSYAGYQQAKSQVSLFKTGIIPQAQQTVASMMAGYQVNKVDFLNLVRSQITLYNYETQYWRVLAQANQSLARLSLAVGQDIPTQSQQGTGE